MVNANFFFNPSMYASMYVILTGNASSGCVEMVFCSQTKDISTDTWADVSELYLLVVLMGNGMAVIMQHIPGLIQPPKSSGSVVDYTWLWHGFVAEFTCVFQGKVDRPIAPLFWKSVWKLIAFFPSAWFTIELSKTSLGLLWSLTWKDIACSMINLCVLGSRSDLIPHRALLCWLIVIFT